MDGRFYTTWFSFVAFIKSPNDENDFDASISSKIKTLLCLFSFALVLVFLSTPIFSLLKFLNILDPGSNVLEDLLFDFSFIQLVFVIAIIGPIFEELIFRLPLRYKYNYLFRSIVFLISATRLIPEEKLKDMVQRYWKRIFKYLFYFLAILFGFIHVTNFERFKDLWAWMPFLTINQLFAGFVLGYIRIKFGLIWSITYHSFYNLLFFGIAFLSLNTLSNYNFTGDSYSVSIKKVAKPTHSYTTDFKIIPGKIEFANYKLSQVLQVLEARPEKYLLISKYKGMYIDINFSSGVKTYSTDSAKRIVIDHLQKAFSLKFKKQLKTKEVLVLFVSDSIKNRMTFPSDISSNRKLCLKQIGRSLDYFYNDLFIAGSDTNHIYSIDLNRMLSFPDMQQYLLKNFGIEFRKMTKELEFTKVD
jgi:membrane protease YdiL (CAAX protease family)